ncbi:MAG: YceI family protein [Enterobacteriaceae bacterium]
MINTRLKKTVLALVASATLFASANASAATYKIDNEGNHASIVFRIQHLGYSWIYGMFKDFSGTFNFDPANPSADSVNVLIKTDSVDTNHAERDKHLRSADFLNVKKNPEAHFQSTKVTKQGDDYLIDGNLTLNGVTKPIQINAKLVGAGPDPWGKERAGFIGTTKFKMKEFKIEKDLGPASQEVELTLNVEGIKQ